MNLNAGTESRYLPCFRGASLSPRMVVFSIASTLYLAVAEEGIGSKASLLNLCLPVIASALIAQNSALPQLGGLGWLAGDATSVTP